MTLGAYPLDPATLVGQLRAIVGDTTATPIEGSPTLAHYAIWGDNDLAATLAYTRNDVYRAAGDLYRTLAAQYIQSGKSIKTDDLAIDTRTRGTDLLKVAQSFYDEAALADAAAGGDFFQIIPYSGRSAGHVRPEATPGYATTPELIEGP